MLFKTNPSLLFSKKSSPVRCVSPARRGDIQPFLAIGQRLLSHGHRVRLATHLCYREVVVEAGLEFYPLAGDPVVLSQFMVRSQGFIVPTSLDALKEVQ